MQRVSEKPTRFTCALPDLAMHCSINQATPGRFRSIIIDQPTIIFVRHGWKQVIHDAQEMTAGAGETIFLPQGLETTIINGCEPGGAYRSDAFVLQNSLVEIYGGADIKPTTEPVLVRPDGGLLDAMDRAGQTLARGVGTGLAVHRHILGELVVRLVDCGINPCPARPENPVFRLRRLLRTDPARDWRSAEAAAHMAVSEQTLRRRLSQAGTTLTDILADVRMTTALSLLQATELPINRIALDVGYESASKFAARFRTRFGLSPRDIRSMAELERPGAENERFGAAAE